ncbi:MAG: DUF1800 family protein, partial [Bdellovibrionales bacterium]|nr:DUF1800 family protein [Bdellovibrionales bacterium]
HYLLEKAAFGRSAKESAIVSAGLSGGAAAAVTELMKIKGEPSGMLSKALDYLNEQEGVSLTDAQMTLRGIRQAWLHIMTQTNNPYHEKFALFLLSVWTVGESVVTNSKEIPLMWNYIERLRSTARSSTAQLRDLANEIVTDPFMLIYLNGNYNLKDNPNENFAREFFELFTVGPKNLNGVANYTEKEDIVEAARRFTGWRIVELDDKLLPVFSPQDHDTGTDELFRGTTYACKATAEEDVVACTIGNHPSVAPYYAKEILEFYLTPNPSSVLIKEFAKVIENNDFDLRASMKVLLSSKAFFHPNYRDTLPKQSAEFAVGIIRTLGLPFHMEGGSGLERTISDKMAQG